MKIRAVIFDVYKTILEVGPPPPDAADRWEFLWEDKLADPPRLSLDDFAAGCREVIGREHAAAKQAGVPYPEIYWPAVAREALPELTHLTEAELDDFLYQHAQMQRTLRLMPGGVEVLRQLEAAKLPLGIASNSQPYTLREFDALLEPAGLSRLLFRPELCFWSFQAGFSKPDPHVFRLLTARLRALGVKPEETLMVGDRLDNDIEPAAAQGWQTWQIGAATGAARNPAGDFVELSRHLASACG